MVDILVYYNPVNFSFDDIVDKLQTRGKIVKMLVKFFSV